MKTRESIAIVGEGITEQYYFKHLKRIRQYRCIVKPRFFQKTSLDEIRKTTERLLSGDVTVICVFDTDTSQRNKKEKEKLQTFTATYRKNKKVLICDSFPSIEFWFLLHFIKTHRTFNTNKLLFDELKKHLSDYDKTTKYLEKVDWVKTLSEKLDIAIKNAKEIPKNGSYSNIYKAIELLEG